MDQTPPCAEGDAAKGAHPPSGTVSVFFCLAAVSAAGSASALLGIGAADAGLAPLFCPIEVEEDASENGQDNGRNDEINHDGLPGGGRVRGVQAVLLLDVPVGTAGQCDDDGDHDDDADEAADGGADIQQGGSGDQRADGVH